jgi:DNA invertase Pin-like site-specific DNA recombinase
VFPDKASGRGTARPQLAELLSFARDGDTVVVHSLDRLAHNWDDLRALVQNLPCKGVRVEFVKEHLVFAGKDSPVANLMLSVMVLSRSLNGPRSERQREGIALAKQRGAHHGRKKTLTRERAAELVQRAANGIPKAVLASDYGITGLRTDNARSRKNPVLLRAYWLPAPIRRATFVVTVSQRPGMQQLLGAVSDIGIRRQW